MTKWKPTEEAERLMDKASKPVPADQSGDDWIPTREAMKILRCKSRQTVHEYYDQGKLHRRFQRSNRFYLYSRSECLAFVEGRVCDGT